MDRNGSTIIPDVRRLPYQPQRNSMQHQPEEVQQRSPAPSEQPVAPAKLHKHKARRLRPRLLIAGAGVLALLIVAGGLIVWQRMGDKPITAFTIGSGTEKPDDGQFVNQANVAQGETLRLQIRYQPEKVKSLSMQIQGSDGKEVFKSGDFKLNNQTEFSLAMNTASLKPGDYKVIVTDQDKKQIQLSDLSIGKAEKKKTDDA